MKTLLVLLLTSAICAASTLPDFPFLFVTGEGAESGATEKAVITILIEIESTDSAQGEKLFQKATQNVRSLLLESAVGEDALNIQAASKSKTNRSRDRENEVAYFRFQQEFKVKTSDFKMYPDLLSKLASSPDVSRMSVEFIPKDDKAVIDRSQQNAFKDASDRAHQLAKAAGVEVKGVHSISELPFSELDRFLPSYGFGASMAGEAAETPYTVPPTVTRYSEVFMLFSLSEKEK